MAFLDITPSRSHRLVIYITGGIVGAWGVAAVFTTAFQCPAPDRWDATAASCMDIVSVVRIYSLLVSELTRIYIGDGADCSSEHHDSH